MGGRGRWQGGADAQAVRSWDWDRRDEDDRDSEVPSDWREENGDLVFRWVGMSKPQAQTYFEKNIRPFTDFYERDGNYVSAVQHIDRYIIDDYQLGSIVQDYRSDLVHRMDTDRR